jgi:hypothetical protein
MVCVLPVLSIYATYKIFEWGAKIPKIQAPPLNRIIPISLLSKAHVFKFKQTFSLEERKSKFEEYQFNYPDQIPFIV